MFASSIAGIESNSLTEVSFADLTFYNLLQVCQALRDNTSVTSCSFDDCNFVDIDGGHNASGRIGNESARDIALALDCNITLRHLSFRNNALGDQAAIFIGDVIARNASLKSLTISQNKGRSADSDSSIRREGGEAIGRGLHFNKSIQTISLSKNRIGDGAWKIGEALINNSTLKEISLNDNAIDDRTATSIGVGLRNNNALIHLFLMKNRIGDDGAHGIFRALRDNLALKKITLGLNHIGDVGANTIANCLRVNTTLRHVDLTSNRIGADGASAIAESLAVNTTLQYLGLNANEIGAQGAAAIGNAIAANRGLHELHLDDNKIGSAPFDSLNAPMCVALACNDILIEISLKRNGIDAKALLNINAALAQNKSTALKQVAISEDEHIINNRLRLS